MPLCSVHQILATAGSEPVQVSRVGQAVSLFMLVGAILGILIIGVLLVTLARHIRRRQPVKEDDGNTTDAWREAGRRAQPLGSDTPDT